MASLTRFLTTPLTLTVNAQKSAVARPRERKFFGFSFMGGPVPKRRIAPQALQRFKERVRELTRRTRGVSTERVVRELTDYLTGWRNYFAFCETPSVLQALDSWIRRRLRCAVWKPWKHGRRRFTELRKRGIGEVLAAQTASSAYGPWRRSISHGLSIALPNAYFHSLGLPTLASRLTASTTEPPWYGPVCQVV